MTRTEKENLVPVWEQDAGCSNHLTPTIQERPPFEAVFCDIKQTVEHALRPSGT